MKHLKLLFIAIFVFNLNAYSQTDSEKTKICKVCPYNTQEKIVHFFEQCLKRIKEGAAFMLGISPCDEQCRVLE